MTCIAPSSPALMADPAPGLDRRSHIVTTLGEVADLWPESVRDEAEAA